MSDDASLYGVTIEREAARKALRMGRDAFAEAVKAGEIPSIKIGKRYRILGAPFRRMVGLPEAETQSAA